MQRSDENPIWDLVICIAGSVGTVFNLVWAYMVLQNNLPMPWNRQFMSVMAIIIALISLGMALSSGYQWKHRR